MELSRKAEEGLFFELDEEIFLGRVMKTGRENPNDRKAVRRAESAKQSLAKANMKLVYHIANKIYNQYPRGTTREDCVSAGMIGMSRALTDYEPDKGFKFSTYATRWIYHYVQRMGHKIARIANLPGSKIDVITKVRREKAALEQDGVKITPSVFDEILRKHGIDEAEYMKISAFNDGASSLDLPAYDNNVASTMADLFKYDQSSMSTLGSEPEGPEDSTIQSDKMKAFNNALDKLNPTQRRLIDLLYLGDQPMGKNGELNRTPASARRELGISKGEADRETRRAMSIIRNEMTKAGYDSSSM